MPQPALSDLLSVFRRNRQGSKPSLPVSQVMVHFRKIAFLSKSGDYPTSEYFSKVMVTAKLCDIRRERDFPVHL
jgi:hypothetical protein